MGFFYRTIRIVENGIKPAYVFDGKPPELKAGVVRVNTCSRATSRGLMTRALQLAKRFERREEAKADGEEAKETGRLPHSCHSPGTQFICSTGTTEDVERFSRRTVKVTREHNEECRRLLKLMGIPVIVVWSRFSLLKTDVNCFKGTLRSRGPMCGTRPWREGT